MQKLKNTIRKQIVKAAMEVFKKNGFEKTTMATIAEEAKISTGNIYRYYKNKEDLFYNIIPQDLADVVLSLFKSKIESLSGIEDINSLDSKAEYHIYSEKLLDLCIENRDKIIILMNKAKGTEYADFNLKIIALMENLAVDYAKSINKNYKVTKAKKISLHLIYTSFLHNLINILKTCDKSEELKIILEEYTKYHLSGLKAFFQ